MSRVLAILLLLVPSTASAQEQPRDYPPPPWHLVDLWWDVGEDRTFESYSIDVTLSDDVPADVNLYIAPVGLGHLSKTPFYGGIQTQADGYTKADRRLRKIGRGLLMSMWGERDHDAIRPSIGGLCQSSGHEGDFVSVRRPYEWSKGTYTYKIVHMDRETIGDNKYTWVGAFLYSHEKDENVFIGALRFPGEELMLARQIASFVEIYGRAIAVERIPKLTVTFGNLHVNGEPIERPAVSAIYPKGVPDYADAQADEEGNVVIRVGEAVEDRTRREVKLVALTEHDPMIEAAPVKPDSYVKVNAEEGRTFVEIASQTGIDRTTLTAQGAAWPKPIIVRLHLKGLESFQVSNGQVTWEVAVSSTEAHESRVSLREGDAEEALDETSPYWATARIVGGTERVPLEGGYFEVELPAKLFENNPDQITLRWIDFYR